MSIRLFATLFILTSSLSSLAESLPSYKCMIDLSEGDITESVNLNVDFVNVDTSNPDNVAKGDSISKFSRFPYVASVSLQRQQAIQGISPSTFFVLNIRILRQAQPQSSADYVFSTGSASTSLGDFLFVSGSSMNGQIVVSANCYQRNNKR